MERNVTCKTYPVQRSKGHSAVAGAAYRAGENLVERARSSDAQDKMHRYAGRSLVVREAFIMTPEGAPDWARDRQELWNRVEALETLKASRLGRELQLGFAYELSQEEQKALVIEFTQREFVAKGFIADVAIHNYGRTFPAMGGDAKQSAKLKEWATAGVPFLDRAEAQGLSSEHVLILRGEEGQVSGYKHYQPHAHVRITPRPLEGDVFAKNKYASRPFDRDETAKEWRYEWPKLQNRYLERAGFDVRVRSTSDDEDAYPGVSFLPESDNVQTHAIEQRKHELDEDAREKHEAAKAVEERDQAFKAVHNDTIRQAFVDEHVEPDEEAREGREQLRLAAWWRNATQKFNQWRFEFREQASVWRERFDQQKDRLIGLLGWHHTPEGERPTPDPEPGRPVIPPPEQERER